MTPSFTQAVFVVKIHEKKEVFSQSNMSFMKNRPTVLGGFGGLPQHNSVYFHHQDGKGRHLELATNQEFCQILGK